MRRIFLIGYMGSGKTTIGRVIAAKLNLDFIDLDARIENRMMKSITSIFEEKGEASFRDAERKMLHEVSNFENVVISTGGGAPCFSDNMDFMNRMGLTIYLKSSPQQLFERLQKAKSKRPVIADKSDDELLDFIQMNLERREPFYGRAALVLESEENLPKTILEQKILTSIVPRIEQFINGSSTTV